jgi:hypothetical protein
MTTPDDRPYSQTTDDDRLMTEADREALEHEADDNVPDALVAQDDAVDFRARWQVIQEGFVDDPRNAVTEADRLVDDLLKRLSDTFDQQHHSLEEQWSDGEPSTEDLRKALQRYRAFFQRLLTI